MTTTVLITRHSKPGDLGRYSYRFILPNGNVCSGDWFSTVTDTERAAQGALASLGHDAEFDYSPGCFNA